MSEISNTTRHLYSTSARQALGTCTPKECMIPVTTYITRWTHRYQHISFKMPLMFLKINKHYINFPISTDSDPNTG